MATIPQNRVFVGIVDSLAGLRAIREAVTQTRSRASRLLAIRTYIEPSSDSTPLRSLTATSQLYGIGIHEISTIAREETDHRRRIAQEKALTRCAEYSTPHSVEFRATFQCN